MREFSLRNISVRLYRRPGSPHWWADIRLASGQRHRRSTGETAKRSAAIAADRIAESLAQQAAPAAHDWTVSHCLGTWWADHASTTRSAETIWSNIQNLERCLDVTARITALTNAMLLDFRARRRGEGVQGPTINRDLAYLGAALRHCHDMHGTPLPEINWKRLKYPENEWRKRALSVGEYAALTAAADDGLRLLILAAVTTGLRRGNLFDLEWHQLDLAARTVTIPRSKGRVASVKRLAAPLAAALAARRTALAKETGAVPVGRVFDLTNWRRRWARALAAAQIADFHFHDLRHTFGTWSRRGGASITELQAAMDHGDIKMTMRYDNVTQEEIATTFDRAAALLPKSKGTKRGTVKQKITR